MTTTSWLIIVGAIAITAIIASLVFLRSWKAEIREVEHLTRDLRLIQEDASKSRENTYIRMSQAFYHGSRWQAQHRRVATPDDNPYNSPDTNTPGSIANTD